MPVGDLTQHIFVTCPEALGDNHSSVDLKVNLQPVALKPLNKYEKVGSVVGLKDMVDKEYGIVLFGTSQNVAQASTDGINHVVCADTEQLKKAVLS